MVNYLLVPSSPDNREKCDLELSTLTSYKLSEFVYSILIERNIGLLNQ